MSDHHIPHRGHGAISSLQGRSGRDEHTCVDDGRQPLVGHLDPNEVSPRIEISVSVERARSILSHNQSPDTPFGVPLNPHRGYEYGRVYRLTRPAYAYLNLSPGLNSETRLFVRTNAAEVLRETLAKPDYHCEAIVLGMSIDAYQPIKRELHIAYGVLQVLHGCDHPVGLIIKSTLIERDIDLLVTVAAKNLVIAVVTLTTPGADLARRLEPHAATPSHRLRAIRTLVEAGIPMGVSVAPMIPFVTDDHMGRILGAAREAGATYVSYIVLRLPNELDAVFQDWLMACFSDRVQRVVNHIRDLHGGRDYKVDFVMRVRDIGTWVGLSRQRFYKTAGGLGFGYHRYNERVLDTSQLKPPARVTKPRKSADERQDSLF